MWIYWIIRFFLHSFSDQQLCVLSPNWWKQCYHQHFDIFPQTRRPWQTFGMPSFCRGDSWLYCGRFKTITYSLWVSFSDLDVRVVNFQKIYYYLKTNRETNLISGSLKKIYRRDSWLYCGRFKTITYFLWFSFSDLDDRVGKLSKIY